MTNLALAVAIGAVLAASAPADESEPRPVEQVRADADAVAGMMESDVAGLFLEAAADLPEIEHDRVVFWNRATKTAISTEDAEKLESAELETYNKLELGEQFYYNTSYGTPIAYCRAIDLAGTNGLESADGARILDFGFGGIGHLRLLASLGADCVGLEVLDLLREFYAAPGDTGEIDRAAVAGEGDRGSITLLYGEYPKDQHIKTSVGGGYDLIMSKNTLKLGYIHPERGENAQPLIDLGVSDENYVRTVFEALNPGGLFVVYNIYPKQNPPGEDYIPWATGGFPFDRELTETAGFEIVHWDVDDSTTMRQMAQQLGWSEQMDLDKVFAMYTIVRKPG